MNKVIIVVIIIVMSLPVVAQASCPESSLQQSIDGYDIIVKAKALDTHSGFFTKWFPSFFNDIKANTEFELVADYKGNVEHKFEVEHYKKSSVAEAVNFEKNSEYLLFLQNSGAGLYLDNQCSPITSVLDPKTSDFYERLDGLFTNLNKAKDLIIKEYENDKPFVMDLYAKYPNPESETQIKKNYQNLSDCGDVFGVRDDTPYYLQNFPDPMPSNTYMTRRDLLLDYGRTLFLLGRYEEALRPLCLAPQANQETKFWRALALVKLGLHKKDLNQYEDVSKIEIQDIDLSGLGLGNFDFTSSKLTKLSLINSDLSGSNFSNSQLYEIRATGANFLNSDLSNARLSGEFENANFTNSIFKGARFKDAVLKNAIFEKSDLRGADFGTNDLAYFEGINLTGAMFDETTKWPAGFFPTSKGAIIVDVDKPSEGLPVNRDEYSGNSDEREILRLEQSGTYLIDGVHIKNYSRVYAENKKPNILKVFAAGLMGRTYKNNIGANNTAKADRFGELRVQGDVGLDAVVLDGCIKWENPSDVSGTTGFYTPEGSNETVSVRLHNYVASPESGRQAKVLIQDGLKVSFSKDCFSVNTPAVVSASPPALIDQPMSEEKKRRLGFLKQTALALEKYWADQSPPNLINSPDMPEGTAECPKGELIFTKSGFYSLKNNPIPKGCRHVFVKAWGAAGGGDQGGPGGFTTGIIDVPENVDIDVIVGGAGERARAENFGKGGFNGGGDGGNGEGSHNAFVGGSGGGGRTELLINGQPVLIAGGGGGSGRGSFGYPGGGRNAEEITEAYNRSLNRQSSRRDNTIVSGSNGSGGTAQKGYEGAGSYCIAAKNGQDKNGGRGGVALKGCGAAGGGGGGSGFGGGAGGRHDSPGYGGGGGGLAPEYGITVWGRANGHLPANVDDVYHTGLAGRPNNDGLIAIIWPAPDPENFLTAIAKHKTDVTPFVKDEEKRPNKSTPQAKIQELVKRSLLRPAVDEDAKSWLDALESRELKSPTIDIPPIYGQTLRDVLPKIKLGGAYVVLGDFQYPEGLAGAHAVTFIIPKGQKRPSGKSLHSSIYDMNTLDCYGPLAYSGSEEWCSAIEDKSFGKKRSKIQDSCEFSSLKIPKDLVVYGAGAYSGRKLTGYIDRSGTKAGQIDVAIDETEHPVALILGANDPTFWSIRYTPGTKIHSVIIGGYNHQIISGLPKDVPILASFGKGGMPCDFTYFTPNKLSDLNVVSRKVYDKGADMFFPVGKDGAVIIGDADLDKNALLRSDNVYDVNKGTIDKQSGPSISELIQKGQVCMGQSDPVQKNLIIIDDIEYPQMGFSPTTTFYLPEGVKPKGQPPRGARVVLLDKSSEHMLGASIPGRRPVPTCRYGREEIIRKPDVLNMCVRGSYQKSATSDKELLISVYTKEIEGRADKEAGYLKIFTKLMKENEIPTKFLQCDPDYKNLTGLPIFEPLTFSKSELKTVRKADIHMFPLGSDDEITIVDKEWKYFKIDNQVCREDMNKSSFVYEQPLSEGFGGIGIGLNINRDQILVSNIVDNLPASKSELKEGDRIIAIDNIPVEQKSDLENLQSLRGPVGEEVKLTYTRPQNGDQSHHEVSIHREYIHKDLLKGPQVLMRKENDSKLPYTSFIVFGSGVVPEQMVWKNNKVLENKMTGDVLEFTNKPCFNIVFSETGLMRQDLEDGDVQYMGRMEPYVDASDIPEILKPALKAGASREQYLQNVTRSFQSLVGSRKYLNKDILQDMKQGKLTEAIKKQRASILEFDNDLDGEVTQDEVIERIKQHSSRELYKVDPRVQSVMRYDQDANGLISNEEMLVLDERVEKRISEGFLRPANSYLELDTDQDGQLSVSELEAVAKKAFSTIDKNKDLLISKDEAL